MTLFSHKKRLDARGPYLQVEAENYSGSLGGVVVGMKVVMVVAARLRMW